MKAKPQPARPLKILFADDEIRLQELMAEELPLMGHEVTVCKDGNEAIKALDDSPYDCMILDLDMPGKNGVEVMSWAAEHTPGVEAVMLTGKSTLDSAVAALRLGAFDYLTKPCTLVELQALLGRVAEKRELSRKVDVLTRQLTRIQGTSDLVGSSQPMRAVSALIDKVAMTNSTVLILGETGTGKELVARAVHARSARATGPFVAINCGALPETLIESELFGHKKGAFTGADDHRVGLFEMASGGTLFLDEVGELPRTMQAKLLRALESREIRRVGDNGVIKIDVRIVCATHRDLPEMVAADEFREDLMYRINTFEIHLPPLRSRTEDIPALATHLFHRFRPGLPDGVTLFDASALDALSRHAWPGNVRELANVVEYASIVCDGLPVTRDDLPKNLIEAAASPKIKLHAGPVSLKELELQAIQESLERHSGRKPDAAEELGISLKTLYNKLALIDQERKAA